MDCPKDCPNRKIKAFRYENKIYENESDCERECIHQKACEMWQENFDKLLKLEKDHNAEIRKKLDIIKQELRRSL